ncbi:MAG: hypothetical protein ACYS99_20790 [Planctomycetota bacterium]|jgi:hypothetical protein
MNGTRALLLCLALVLSACGGDRLEEASTNLDLEDLGPLLERIAGLADDGFDADDAKHIAEAARGQEPGWVYSAEFRVKRDGTTTHLRVSVVMDDVDAPDLHVRASPELAAKIQAEMTRYAEERGR